MGSSSKHSISIIIILSLAITNSFVPAVRAEDTFAAGEGISLIGLETCGDGEATDEQGSDEASRGDGAEEIMPTWVEWKLVELGLAPFGINVNVDIEEEATGWRSTQLEVVIPQGANVDGALVAIGAIKGIPQETVESLRRHIPRIWQTFGEEKILLRGQVFERPATGELKLGRRHLVIGNIVPRSPMESAVCVEVGEGVLQSLTTWLVRDELGLSNEASHTAASAPAQATGNAHAQATGNAHAQATSNAPAQATSNAPAQDARQQQPMPIRAGAWNFEGQTRLSDIRVDCSHQVFSIGGSAAISLRGPLPLFKDRGIDLDVNAARVSLEVKQVGRSAAESWELRDLQSKSIAELTGEEILRLRHLRSRDTARLQLTMANEGQLTVTPRLGKSLSGANALVRDAVDSAITSLGTELGSMVQGAIAGKVVFEDEVKVRHFERKSDGSYRLAFAPLVVDLDGTMRHYLPIASPYQLTTCAIEQDRVTIALDYVRSSLKAD